MPAKFFSRRLAICLLAAWLPAVLMAAPAADNAKLRDTRWALQTLDGVPVEGTELHLVLHAGTQHLTGFAGCNRIRGRFTQRGTQLALTALSSTRKACAQPQMQQEQRFIELLGAADAYRIEGRALSLLQGETVRLTFTAVGTN